METTAAGFKHAAIFGQNMVVPPDSDSKTGYKTRRAAATAVKGGIAISAVPDRNF